MADAAIERLKAILAEDPEHFDAQLALGGAYYAKGDYAAAIAVGHKAEKLSPNDQMVHTNLSRAYMKAGDKKTAEHHALQARIASWRGNMAPPRRGRTNRQPCRWPSPSRRRPFPQNSPTCLGRKNKELPFV